MVCVCRRCGSPSAWPESSTVKSQGATSGRKWLPLVLTALVALLALSAYLAWQLYQQAQQLHHQVVAGWGDSKYGKAFYGARVYYVEDAGKPLKVWLVVQIDRGSAWTQYSHNPRLLGEAASPADAVAKWGQLEWTAQGLQVGRSGQASYLFPTSDLENHR
jgi:hypothetical protein